MARLVRLAGTKVDGPIAAERLARVRTAVHGAWRDEYVPPARQEDAAPLAHGRRAARRGGFRRHRVCDPGSDPHAGTGTGTVRRSHIDQATGSPAPASRPAVR